MRKTCTFWERKNKIDGWRGREGERERERVRVADEVRDDKRERERESTRHKGRESMENTISAPMARLSLHSAED